ncbi:uncharacterized protein LACBIDRAFT_316477 [Laccaria bicolor S238N-H82]|uniref:Predicted protein n=1 Tax=Laccaria bicolor (strain S238N-H82 / ATCC MYA-4686) TaxID=486041 RepID=B0E116_LACBS|nr:uncharacterized protein LACBIDRAFT_316477 [Laccaria bicolor S238N-H82]EDQ99503.1 predicted protein [Laccaria bicolor S238N-H82]|eukprot:XP_001889852.1 predicted protein [Laccaria bicolor S238N-H82]
MTCFDNVLSLYDPATKIEVKVLSWQTVFQPIPAMFCVPSNISNKRPTTSWVQLNSGLNGESLRSLDLINMKYDPNWSYQGREVMVINGNFKGYLGHITSTCVDDDVIVELSATM